MTWGFTENADVDVSILLLQEQLDKVEGGWGGLSFGSAPTSATPFHQTEMDFYRETDIGLNDFYQFWA